MGNVYVGDINTEFRLDVDPDGVTGIDLSTADDLIIKVLKPSGTEVEWVATQYGTTTKISYFTLDGDLDEVGKYKLQAFIGWDTPSSEHLGETVAVKVYDKWK